MEHLNRVMKAVFLAAGRGTRRRPLTDDKPKGMVEVDGQPILAHCFERRVAFGRRAASVDPWADP